MTTKCNITTNAALVAAFKAQHQSLDYSPIADGQGGKMYKATTRCAFVDFVDSMARDGQISDSLAQRATFQPRQPKRSR